MAESQPSPLDAAAPSETNLYNPSEPEPVQLADLFSHASAQPTARDNMHEIFVIHPPDANFWQEVGGSDNAQQ